MHIQYIALDQLKPTPRNTRTHSKKQVQQIAQSIRQFGFVVPIVIDENRTILAGHGRHAAAKLLELVEVPTIEVRDLSPAKKRALAIADNKIPNNAGWDREILASELSELSEILLVDHLDISITGFAPAEVDQLLVDFEDKARDPADDIASYTSSTEPITQKGDVWILGPHRILCGDARRENDLAVVIDGRRAAMAFLDPPYNVRVQDISGRGRIKHPEFAMASGEMSSEEFVTFLKATLGAAASVSREGAVHYVCMDWRHIGELLAAGTSVYGGFLNLAVWVKSNAGQGSFYRSQHELIAVFRAGNSPHQNNIELGRHGRNRSNVWQYAGVNAFRSGRLEELKSHPTVKPVALVADAIKDCTQRRDVVLDIFSGSGTTILAAERVGRTAVALEIEPRYVDVAVRRWQAFTGKDALHLASGHSFDELSAMCSMAPPSIPAAA